MRWHQFTHDLFLGHRLYMMRFVHRADGFRGNSKGKGFRAYLEANKIPPRKAYRLIQRYLRMRRIWDAILVTNAALEAELFALPSQEMVAQLGAELEALRDGGAA